MTPEMKRYVHNFYLDEALDAEVYAILAKKTKSEHNRKILEAIAHDERKHKAQWASYLDNLPKLNAFRVWFFTLLAKIFGLTFVLNLMESGEAKAIEEYKAISEQFPIARKILEDESRHEEELAAMDKVAATPVIKPARPIILLSFSARVKPARAPVSSTRASLSPRTMELI